MITIRNVRKRYPEFEIVLDLEIGEAEIVSILGPSGSGKTTTLRLIAGFERADAGSISVNGRDVTALPPERRGIGYVFQDFTLFPHMSVAENVGYALRVRAVPPAAANRRIEELLELVDLRGFGTRRIGSLSGGEQQRVAIARSLAVDPTVLLLDEPFSSVDEVLRSDLRAEVRRLRSELGITVVFVTHSRQEALAISNRVAVYNGGRVVQTGSPEEIYRRPVTPFVASFVGPANYIHRGSEVLLVRPEDVELRTVRRGAVDGTTDAAGDGKLLVLPGEVEAAEFQGHSYLHRCRLEEGAPVSEGAAMGSGAPMESGAPIAPRGTFFEALHSARLAPGTAVELACDMSRAWPLPRE